MNIFVIFSKHFMGQGEILVNISINCIIVVLMLVNSESDGDGEAVEPVDGLLQEARPRVQRAADRCRSLCHCQVGEHGSSILGLKTISPNIQSKLTSQLLVIIETEHCSANTVTWPLCLASQSSLEGRSVQSSAHAT